jgi:plastocyanin
MTGRAAIVVLVAAGAVVTAAPAVAADAPASVNVEFQLFRPSPVEILPGETIQWSNVSQRTHTVTADDGSFDSGDLLGAAQFAQTFSAAGIYLYHCRIHPGMSGEADVRDVILDGLPTALAPIGQAVEFTGRTADATRPVTIEQDTGLGFHEVAQVTPAPNGSWSTKLPATVTGDYRAVSAGHMSGTRHLLVSQRRVIVRATRTGVSVSVVPADPYGRVRLDLEERERFGWWPAAVRRLDYVSQTTFAVRRPALLRVSLVDRRGWTVLATSPTLRLAGKRRTTKSTKPRRHH